MTPKEVIFTAFELGKPERVPVALFGGGMFTMYNTGNSFKSLAEDAKGMADMIISFSRKSLSDIVYVGSGYNNFHAAALGGRIKYREIGAPDLEEPLVDTESDLDRLDLEGLKNSATVRAIWEATELVSRAIGDEFVVTATAWGPFTLGAQIFGVERMMRGTFKTPEFVKRVVDFAADLNIKFYADLVERGIIKMISLADPTASGDLISRKQFENFALPYLQKFTSWAKTKGVKVLVHICGDTSDRLDLFPKMGADCISLDHKVDIAKAKAELSGKICFAGNVNPVAVLNNGTPSDVEVVCLRCIETAGLEGGFVLMPGCDIPPTVPVKNVETFVNIARGWKLN
ncbi:MAG: uroporphyrinogen decarboxylase family protein [Nitrospirota bacterium]